MSVADRIRAKFSGLTEEQKFDKLSPKKRWENVKGSWERATRFYESMKSRGLLDNKIDEETKTLRMLSCHGDENHDPCEARAWSKKGKFHYCDYCGCGESRIARLDGQGYTKLDYPVLHCPLRRPGFSNELVQETSS